MKTPTARCLAGVALALAVALPARAEVSAAIGVFTLTDGLDVQLAYRAEHSPWQWGLRFVRWSEEYEFGGTSLTQTTTTKVGPLANYLFSPASRSSWYAGAALYRWTQEEQSVRTGTAGKESKTALFFGGGYQGRFARYGYYNLGILLSPAKITTRTADSSEESTGADLQVQVGFAF